MTASISFPDILTFSLRKRVSQHPQHSVRSTNSFAKMRQGIFYETEDSVEILSQDFERQIVSQGFMSQDFVPGEIVSQDFISKDFSQDFISKDFSQDLVSQNFSQDFVPGQIVYEEISEVTEVSISISETSVYVVILVTVLLIMMRLQQRA